MGRTLKEIIQEINGLSPNEKVSVARNAVNSLGQAINNSEDLIGLMRMIACIFVSADRNCGRDEYSLYIGATNDKVSYEEFYEITDGGSDPVLVNKFLTFVDSIAEEYRASIAIFGLCLMCHDNNLTPEEEKLFNRVLGY